MFGTAGGSATTGTERVPYWLDGFIPLADGTEIRIRQATPAEQESAKTRSLRHAAKVAGKTAVAKTFSKGLPITIGREGKLIQIYPDGHEVILGELRRP